MTVTDEAAERGRAETIRAVPVRHWGRWIAALLVAYLLVWFVWSLAHNQNLHWDVVRQNLTIDVILHGVLVTLELTVVAMVIGIVGGAFLAVMRLSANPLISGTAWVYVWFVRGTPVLVQILAWAFINAFSANSLITPFVAGCLGLGLNEAAYMAEIVRAGIVSVDPGQDEASTALGMTRGQTLRRIVLPQAMRVIIPPTGNEVISMLKNSALVSAIAVSDLLFSAQIIYGRTYQTIPLLVVASIWYLVMTSVLSVGQFYLERYFGRGAAQRQTMIEQFVARARRSAGRGEA
jgi:polar amino acid transport system permease protein